MNYQTRLTRQLWSLVFPINCLSCGRESDWLCDDCLASLKLSRVDLCHLCGKAGENGLCQSCRQSTKLDGLISLFSYNQKPIQKLIKAVKYQGQTDGLNFLIDHFFRKLDQPLPKLNWHYQPIPLSSSRVASRGFNQAEIFARLMAKNVWPIASMLKRPIDTQPQVELDKKARLKNLRGSFAIKPSAVVPDEIVLFDDVVTTGTTLKEAAKVFRKAGTKTIWAVTIAHG